ncbi:hypothetical protein M409DRAFT_27314 [Zasmidium cellare ATCC 36951]|uniref:F-box domain-containing protein n=1 Tax=Zasmidium cellare ATCC 36951 TaxID=1080233 RepID=A0A6A6C7Y0_ZASCE|nr:uncharacterized protein M409DRAFT_27314 [Zasmidium cellare ATCC 36951]KAF2162310.1 hypothetical protein M409DRAFT_27314 [Zasmidium cellare ATCC 36951]
MSRLIDLPGELLCQILEEVGGSHLRRDNGSARLCVCRKWYAAARPVYLSGLGTTKVNIFGHNLGELETKYSYSSLRRLMHKNTREMRIRLLGHYWDENSCQAFDSEYVEDDEEGGAAGPPTPINEPPIEFEEPEHIVALEQWRDRYLRPQLDALFTDLRHLEALESLTFEASADPEVGHERGPHWDYLYQSTILTFLHNLPVTHDLKDLTLDISGLRNGLLNDSEADHHLCTSLAKILPRIENVRLRMPTLCEKIFALDSNLQPNEIRLRTLIIKLHLPTFRYTDEARVQRCPLSPGTRTSQALLLTFARNSDIFMKKLAQLRGSGTGHGITGLRISFAFPVTPSVSTLDCLTMRVQNLPEDYFLYEDDGKPNWYELSQAGRMLNGGAFNIGTT